jgi:hypothetical protein
MKQARDMGAMSAVIRIVALYVLFSGLWIYFSDTILGGIIHDPDLITRLAICKGFAFLLVTATLLCFLICHAFDPTACLIVSSGYSSDPVLPNSRKYGFSASLSKPFRIQDLGAALRKVLGAELHRVDGGIERYTQLGWRSARLVKL